MHGKSFSKWKSSSAGQRLLLSSSGFTGFEIFHSLVKVQVDKTNTKLSAPGWDRKGENWGQKKSVLIGWEGEWDSSSESPLVRVRWWNTRSVSPLPPCSGSPWETQLMRLRMAGNTEQLKPYHFTPPWNRFYAFPSTATVSPQIYTHSLCCEQRCGVLSNVLWIWAIKIFS